MNTSTSNSPSRRDSGLVTPLGGRASQQALPRDVSSLGMGLLPGPALSAMGAGRGPQRPGKLPRELNPEEQQELRRRINSRERKRMQDLNMAMDALREVMMPYSSPAAQHHPHHSRRLSKISTLILARNYILLLGSSLQEMRRLLGEVSVGMGVGVGRGVGLGGVTPRLLLAGNWPFLTTPGQLLFTSDSLLTSTKSSVPLQPTEEATLIQPQWSTGEGPGGQLCSCGACKLPHVIHTSPGTRYPK
ncbi:oligodendrocyte transcription factor 1 [Brienomyrus brachyistius]|uniref:oligodendrocyte transcription factor 1 n=1 Tax=Brienomyrus brachyistius TaxID=42636 RepID=UPI0020B377CD|nr:oligodendrocyte transcription factor 1 [Brienomyrus brachyistius]XP_048834794.1 oligodendrocyte transcription factor 1 [Brienomyrus brachyistius]